MKIDILIDIFTPKYNIIYIIWYTLRGCRLAVLFHSVVVAMITRGGEAYNRLRDHQRDADCSVGRDWHCHSVHFDRKEIISRNRLLNGDGFNPLFLWNDRHTQSGSHFLYLLYQSFFILQPEFERLCAAPASVVTVQTLAGMPSAVACLFSTRFSVQWKNGQRSERSERRSERSERCIAAKPRKPGRRGTTELKPLCHCHCGSVATAAIHEPLDCFASLAMTVRVRIVAFGFGSESIDGNGGF
ncbi:MAG: hypothetical protein LBS91_06040 [Clostridiales Family XIII bacterium]|jgi:hypothetical protein|nr:hypothetical protein [Clostridiales Family XIII bacterium]